MIKIKDKEGLTFDDVILEPRRSTIGSRFNGEIDFTTELLPGIKLKTPIISANMDTVSELKMTNAINSLGGLGIIHRFMSKEEQYDQLNKTVGHRIGCVGVGAAGIERAEFINELCDAFLIDIAHGHSDAVVEQARKLIDNFSKPIIAGNIATAEGALDLVNAGIHCIKCGVGCGSVCTTRIQTGSGVPQLSAIDDIYLTIEDWYKGKEGTFKPTIIADGGVRNSGDIMKSLAAGADAVMMGNIFAGTTESPGQVINMPGIGRVKLFRGMASREAQKDWKGESTSVEGEITYVPYKGSVVNIFSDLVNGMRSGMSYQNARNVEELRKNAVFIRQTSAGVAEARPHGLKK